jgi:serine/threonine protein kinase
MKNRLVELYPNTVTKYSNSKSGDIRLAREIQVYMSLEGSIHIPKLIEATFAHGTEPASFTIERINGATMGEELGVGPNWQGQPNAWQNVKPILTQLVAAETDFLEKNVLYRDIAPRHIFHVLMPNDLERVVLIDLEGSLIDRTDGAWRTDEPMNVAYETMAPEEFSRQIELTEATATYHSAVLAHVALAGRLPYPRWLPKISARIGRHLPEEYFSKALPEGAEVVIQKALSRDPEQRQASPDVFLADLAHTLD